MDESGRAHGLLEHLRAVGELAERFASHFGAGSFARVAGLWHDLGKYGPEFQNRIRQAHGFTAHLEATPTSDRDHSTAGAVLAKDKLGAAGALLAFAIAGHHAGLPNRRELDDRILRKRGLCDLALQHGGTEVADATVPAWSPPSLPRDERWRYAELWTRLVFSALCDADFLDTEEFFDGARAALRAPGPPLAELDRRLNDFMAQKEEAARSNATEVNRVRAEVRAACLAAAAKPPGVFSLTVPAGGGKTLASLSFALRHALAHGLRRVIVAIPFTSIIEQTAEVYREVLGDDAVIEHHSGLDPQRETPRNRIACENWDAPLVVTTTVQLLESLLSNRPSACRKLHNLVGSVIILDEAQSLPSGHLAPILDVLRELSRSFRVSLVFSTATQPAFRQDSLPTFQGLPLGFAAIDEIVPPSLTAFARLRRVRVRWPEAVDQACSYDALADDVAREPDVLVIVHRRADAQTLCLLLDQRLGEASTLHLSALMCPAHRSLILAEIKQRKARGEAVRVVATQLVEAGVDLDFPVVYRALGGLDALAQAAGRCNREGKLRELGELRVFVAPTAPPCGVPRAALAVTQRQLRSSRRPDLNAPETFTAYFRELYNVRTLDEKQLQEARAGLRFSDTSEAFRIIEDGWSSPLVIPYDEPVEALLDELRRYGPARSRLRALQRYTVNVPAKDRETWIGSGAVEWICETIAALRPSHRAAYSERFGLVPKQVGACAPETLIA